jgi:benzoyl-CoA reductase/2-hydroxyglutaryl-CoA dehydratase subunit BcrC/BadD/HgdB
LRRFTAALEKHFDVRVTDDRVSRASIRAYNARRRALADFYAHRVPSFSAVEWFNVMNRALTSPPETVGGQRSAVSDRQSAIENQKSKIGLVLLGATIDEPTLPQILDDLGARIVAGRFLQRARDISIRSSPKMAIPSKRWRCANSHARRVRANIARWTIASSAC